MAEEENLVKKSRKLDTGEHSSYGAVNINIALSNMENEILDKQEGLLIQEPKRSTFSRLLSGIEDVKERTRTWRQTSMDTYSGITHVSDETEDSSTDPVGDIINSGEELDESNTQSSFCNFFVTSSGPPQIIFLCMIYALAIGCTIGVVPSVMIDQYAKIYHNFDHGDSCAYYDKLNKPQACFDGSSDAQTAAVSSSFVSNTLTFLTSSLIGAISDEYGRRNLLNFAQFTALFAPLYLVMMQTQTSSGFILNPNWYYISQCFGGCVSWISIALSALSDVMPKQWRAPTFGLLLSGFSLGFALSPFLALALTHYGVSILSLSMLVGGFLYSIFFLPETLSDQAMEAARMVRMQRSENHIHDHDDSLFIGVARMLSRPIRELAILNRNCLFRLLSALAFFSGMSSSADQTLLLYYVEERLDFNDKDVAIMFGIIGFLGIFVQGLLLKPFTDLVGERYVVVVSFICGAVTNTLYAFAQSKQSIFLAVCVSSFGSMAFPTISAMKANNVAEFEQGRIQGALYALSSLASAVGPCLLRLVYQVTKETRYPGSFFLVATSFFIVATLCGYALPEEKANSVVTHGISASMNNRSRSALSEDDDDDDQASREALLADME